MTIVSKTVIRGALALLASAVPFSAGAQTIHSAYTAFNASKDCRHTPGADEEDYGTWRCRGYGGQIVRLSAGDQRMTVSFGVNMKRAGGEIAAGESFPGFNNVYSGLIEWRIETLSNGSTRPFATILRWNLVTAADTERGDGKSTGQKLVVTRLNPGGVCHVGYVDARSPGANEAARKLADDKARNFRCEIDKPE